MSLISALIGQVTMAAAGDTELNVITYITRPLWRQFNQTLGEVKDVEPTPWLGIGKTHRVYGSETIVVETPGLWAVSFNKHPKTPPLPTPRL